MRRDDFTAYLAKYLHSDGFDDDSLNGLQVEGSDDIHRVAFAVSACAEAFTAAVEAGANALVVHHGLLWRGRGPDPIVGTLRERLGILLAGGINLYAYHLPLDAHPEVGNNAAAARFLGLENLAPFGEYHGVNIGWRGTLPKPEPRDAFIVRLEAFYGHKSMVVPGGPSLISTVGIVSGGAAKEAPQASAAGIDFFVTGEPAEPITYLCREMGINFAALGHYATERVGILALQEHLRASLGLEVLFIELENLA